MKKETLFIKAAKCKKTDRPPVWFMRQAGRYLKEYRELRSKQDFKTLIKTPEVACEITLQPIRRFKMDAAILFSDILVTPEAMGMQLDYKESIGPVFSNPIKNETDVINLDLQNIPEKLSYVTNAISLIKPELVSYDIPLIGFAGAPFTVASYMIEGVMSPSLKKVKTMMYQNPELFHLLLSKITQITIQYLNAQIKAGVNALQLFDTWAGSLAWDDFRAVSMIYLKKIIQSLDNPDNIPVTVFCKGSSFFAPLLSETGADVIGLDWQANLKDIRRSLGNNIALQGNLDPSLLYAPEKTLTARVQRILSDMADEPGFIFNLGHGVMPDVDPEKIKLIVDLVKN